MFSIIGGRIFQRGQPVLLYFAFISGEVKSSNKSSNLSTIPPRQRFKIITAVSGFAKPKKTLKPYIPVSSGTGVLLVPDHQVPEDATPASILDGKVGEDAYFRAHYVGEIYEDKLDSKITIIDQKPAPAYVLGVADGVGSWNQMGIDPSLFSNNLMQNCKRLVKEGNFVNDKPMELLDSAFYEMEEASKPIGSSTACISILNQSDGKLFTANLGDSGFRVIRKGEIVQRSQEQQHSFNYPYQLAIVPSDWQQDSKDMPLDSDNYEFTVEHGDIIALASDGVLDNVYDSEMAKEIGGLQIGADTPNTEKLQACADSITSKAKKNQQNRRYLSPFAKNAQAQGINFMGGKEDDTTLLLASVSLIPDGEKAQEKDEL